MEYPKKEMEENYKGNHEKQVDKEWLWKQNRDCTVVSSREKKNTEVSETGGHCIPDLSVKYQGMSTM